MDIPFECLIYILIVMGKIVMGKAIMSNLFLVYFMVFINIYSLGLGIRSITK